MGISNCWPSENINQRSVMPRQLKIPNYSYKGGLVKAMWGHRVIQVVKNMWTSRCKHSFIWERTIYNSAFQELLCGLQIEVVHCPLTAPVICKTSKKGRMALRQILVCSVSDTFLNILDLKFTFLCFLSYLFQ